MGPGRWSGATVADVTVVVAVTTTRSRPRAKPRASRGSRGAWSLRAGGGHRRRPPRGSSRGKAAASGPSPAQRLGASVSEYLRSHPGEAGGLALVAGGALVGFAVYAGLSGIAGRGLRDAAATAAGWGKVMLPPAMVAVGFVLILGRPKPEPSRAAIGSGTILAAVCGIP